MPYYLYDGNKHIGPFEPAELLKRPGFGPSTLVYPVGATGADAWKPASAFPDLAAPPPPQDTRAEITLVMPPPRKVEEAPTPAPVVEAPKPAPAPAAPKGDDPATKLILVVDDDEAVRSFVEMTVMGGGFQVVTAVDGKDAQEKLAARAPDLIVTDLMMPGVGGYEFLRSLQAAGSGRIPVFVVTGSTLEDSTIKMIRGEANVVEFIPKPIRVPVFVAALHKHLKTAPR